jgi:hypothetical protein
MYESVCVSHHILESLLNKQPFQTGPAAFLGNHLAYAKTKKEGELKRERDQVLVLLFPLFCHLGFAAMLRG